MNKIKKTFLLSYILIIMAMLVLNLYLYLANPLEKELKIPLMLFVVFSAFPVFFKKIWALILFLAFMLFISIAYYYGIRLF